MFSYVDREPAIRPRRSGTTGAAEIDFVHEGLAVVDARHDAARGRNQRAGLGLPLAALAAWAEGGKPDPAWFEIEPGVQTGRADLFVLTQRPERTGENGNFMKLSEK